MCKTGLCRGQSSLSTKDEHVWGNKSTIRLFVVSTIVLLVISTLISLISNDGFLKSKEEMEMIQVKSNESDKYDNNQQPPLDTKSEKIVQCFTEYNDIKSNQTFGLIDEDYANSRAFHGSTRRLELLLEKLQSRQKPVTVVSHGGSISLGHGINPGSGLYSNAFVDWLNTYYPVFSESNTTSNEVKKHKLINHSRHGADVSQRPNIC
jgi:hypothetical protein